MSAMSDLRLIIRSEISSLVVMSCFRPAMRSERSGVVGGSTSVSILLEVRVSVLLVEGLTGIDARTDAISLLICSTVLVSRVRSVWISFLSDCSSVAYFISMLDRLEVLELGGKLLLLLALLLDVRSTWFTDSGG